MPLLFWLQPKEVGAFRKDSARERRARRNVTGRERGKTKKFRTQNVQVFQNKLNETLCLVCSVHF